MHCCGGGSFWVIRNAQDQCVSDTVKSNPTFEPHIFIPLDRSTSSSPRGVRLLGSTVYLLMPTEIFGSEMAALGG